MRGLPTLRAFGRARYQATVIAEVADEHRSATMRTLRVAFLSSLVLELCASLSLAMLAVPVGLRLLNGSLDLTTGLLVLLLAPEAYLPLRAVGAGFHASMEGPAAADSAFALLERTPRPDRPGPAVLKAPPGDAARHRGPRCEFSPPERAPEGGRPGRVAPEIRLEGVTVRYPGREEPALEDVHLVIGPGERVALVGPSGGGQEHAAGRVDATGGARVRNHPGQRGGRR